ncbi:divergent polysaccharide deacetylase family protein [Oceaniglobus indicus]|uniref:divergent polysaccharide deacetylase family protein n=1 Tax=Oceaniglobus indicus TaxID=2047749 RepID=UPI001303FE10|nr:divergent polysaccharide deacetylase family protein [Oceaniglobus indicus]
MAGKTITGILGGAFWGAAFGALLLALAAQQVTRRSLEPSQGDADSPAVSEGVESPAAIVTPEAEKPAAKILDEGADPRPVERDQTGTVPKAPSVPDLVDAPAPGVDDPEAPDVDADTPGAPLSGEADGTGAAAPAPDSPPDADGEPPAMPNAPGPAATRMQSPADPAGVAAVVQDATAPASPPLEAGQMPADPSAPDTASPARTVPDAVSAPSAEPTPDAAAMDTRPPAPPVAPAPAVVSDAPDAGAAPTLDTDPGGAPVADAAPRRAGDPPGVTVVVAADDVPSPQVAHATPEVGRTPDRMAPQRADDDAGRPPSRTAALARAPSPDAPVAPGPADGPPMTIGDAPAPTGPDPAEAPAVITDRLPRIGDAPAADGDAVEPVAEIETVQTDALSRNGEPFETETGKPLVAVILLDTGGPPVSLSLPVSIALDPALENAAARAAAYRAAGHEVLMVQTLPGGATATDAAVALEANLKAFDMAVAVMDTEDSALQSNRDGIAEIAARLTETGHGFVSFPKGLNTGLQAVARSDVPAGLVFRQIDDAGQDRRAVKRFLDQAAFRARQEQAVILVGRNRPETTEALVEWASGNRAASVALAPVSAALKAMESTER